MEQNLRTKNILAALVTMLLALMLGLFTANAQPTPNYADDNVCNCVKEEERGGDYLVSPVNGCTITLFWKQQRSDKWQQSKAVKVIVYANQRYLVYVNQEGDIVKVYSVGSYYIAAHNKKGGVL